MLMNITLKNPSLFRAANLISGEWTSASSAGEAIGVTDPATGVLLGTVPNGGQAETRRAVEAAHTSYPAWRAMTAADRATLLRRLAQLITDNQEDLAKLLTLNKASRWRRRGRSVCPQRIFSGSRKKRGASTVT